MNCLLLILFTIAMLVGSVFGVAALVRRELWLREVRRAIEEAGKP